MRRDVLLRCTGPAAAPVLVEVWVSSFDDFGQAVGIVQLQPESLQYCDQLLLRRAAHLAAHLTQLELF